jgi:uncharacterized membrane protein (DUF2068 family)
MEMLKQSGVHAVHPVQDAQGPVHPAEPCPAESSDDSSDTGLLLVGLFKLSKALFFGAVGAGALHLIHQNIGDVVMRIVDRLPIDPEGHFVSLLMDKVDLIGGHQLRQAGLLSFLYAALCVVEGTGLMLKKSWAEYFTVILTAGALPVETYELVEKFEWFKVVLLLINVVVLLYLLWVLKRKRVRAAAAGA